MQCLVVLRVLVLAATVMVSDIEYLAVAAESGPVTLIDFTDDLNRTISDLRGGATEGLASLTTAVG